jgi:hypothetical protein
MAQKRYSGDTDMSKFAKPKSAGTTSAVTQADIDRVIEKADAVDDRKPEPKPDQKPSKGVIFTMSITDEMAGQIDIARKRSGGLTRLSWIRLAVAEKLARDGV